MPGVGPLDLQPVLRRLLNNCTPRVLTKNLTVLCGSIIKLLLIELIKVE